MAPVAPTEKNPSARAKRHMRITGQLHPLLPAKVFRPDAAVSDDFLSNKRDKRLMKHSSFVSRIASSRVAKPKKRTRRPGNKLSTTLDGLADALPDLDDGDDAAGGDGQAPDGKVRHRSLRSKKGALKRKEMIVRGEMERFGVSMARLSETQPARGQKKTKKQASAATNPTNQEATAAAAAPAPATSNRWAALRGYISATMEQNPAFTNKN